MDKSVFGKTRMLPEAGHMEMVALYERKHLCCRES